MIGEKNSEDHTCQGSRFPQETPENPLDDEKNHRADNDDIEQIHADMFTRAGEASSRPIPG
jgi:hypothetical protein